MTKKIFQDDGQWVELGSLGKSGQGLARQGLLGGMGWSWWSRQINLHAMRPKTHKWLPSWSQDDVCGTLWHRHTHIYTAGDSSGRDGPYLAQTRYLTNIICMAEVWVGLVISCPDMI